VMFGFGLGERKVWTSSLLAVKIIRNRINDEELRADNIPSRASLSSLALKSPHTLLSPLGSPVNSMLVNAFV
jgi:hypothetical protein